MIRKIGRHVVSFADVGVPVALGLALSVGAAHAFTAPAAGDLGYDIYDIVVNKGVKGPLGFVAGVAAFLFGVSRLFSNIMVGIATKIRTKAALTTEERQFVANVRTLPVYRMLEWGVREGVTDSVISDTDELVALTLAYQMLNDLTRTIDFALSNAERGTDAAGAVDAASPDLCQTRILTKGLEQLRGLREEVLRQRAQMRQSYVAALGAANLSANYAGLVRQRDRDARDAAGADARR